MGADSKVASFENRFRSHAKSLALYKLRPSTNDLIVSFEDERDFFAVVSSASSSNIFLEVGCLFESSRAKASVGNCFLRFLLVDHCEDDRLENFLDDLSLQLKS